MSQKKPKIKIVNQVVTADLGCKLVLEPITSKLSATEYNPEQFPGLVLRIKEPKSSILLFTSGKIVCAGTKSIDDSKTAVNNAIKLLNKIGYKIDSNPELSVQNMVASGNLGFDLNLNHLAMKLRNTEYEPEQFPGLVYKIKEPHASFLLFSNGNLVCTGTKNEEDIYEALDKLIVDLKKVKK